MMRLSIRSTQVLGVTAIVAVVVVGLSVLHLAQTAAGRLVDTGARASLLARAIEYRARDVANAAIANGRPVEAAWRADDGLRSQLEAALYDPAVTAAAVASARGVALVDTDPSREGHPLPPTTALDHLLRTSAVWQLATIYRDQGRSLTVIEPIQAGDRAVGSVRVGVSTLLIRRDLRRTLEPAAWMAMVALIVAVVGATVLARVIVRPIHLIRSGLTRLDEGEADVQLDLKAGEEFDDLERAFNDLSARLATTASHDATWAAAEISVRQVTEALRYSRKLAALGRVSAGIAHEVKNPLNAMTIHLELVRLQVQERMSTGRDETLAHLEVIGAEVRRLDDVLHGFLRFTTPEEVTLQPVDLRRLLEGLLPVIEPDATQRGVTVSIAHEGAAVVLGDAAMLRQALLNLTLNACQAMPHGGALTVRSAPARDGRVRVTVTDTGEGIAAEHLGKVFNLYYTTKARGTGLGLAMVFRTVHLHDGDIAIESTQGRGTTVTVTLPAA